MSSANKNSHRNQTDEESDSGSKSGQDPAEKLGTTRKTGKGGKLSDNESELLSQLGYAEDSRDAAEPPPEFGARSSWTLDRSPPGR